MSVSVCFVCTCIVMIAMYYFLPFPIFFCVCVVHLFVYVCFYMCGCGCACACMHFVFYVHVKTPGWCWELSLFIFYIEAPSLNQIRSLLISLVLLASLFWHLLSLPSEARIIGRVPHPSVIYVGCWGSKLPSSQLSTSTLSLWAVSPVPCSLWVVCVINMFRWSLSLLTTLGLKFAFSVIILSALVFV